MCGYCDAGGALEACVSRMRRAGRISSAKAVLVIEEKPICQQAIAMVVGAVIGEEPTRFAPTLGEGRRIVDSEPVDLLLVDLFSIGFDFEGLKALVMATDAATLAIDDRPNPSFAALAQLVGAHGYTSKSYAIERFKGAIRTVVEGGVHFPLVPPRTARAPGSDDPRPRLSPRQLDVLRCIGVGMSNQEIARTLGIAPGTVKLHIHAILRLTGTRNRTEAALIAGRYFATGIDR